MTTAPRVESLETSPPIERRKAPKASFRGDIQGLRAVAVVVVLLYHTGLGPSGGFIGVDVFFVLSGFLITGLLAREHDRTGRISLPRFWARRLRRLLPASALVVLATLVATHAYLPASRWGSVGQDAVAAAGYFLNWRLAAESVDYLSEGTFASPLQHFWSLAIEEQFYLVWPLLIGLVLRARSRKVAVAVISMVLAGSLALALLTYSPQTYFTTQTRIWELAAGALCAVAFSSRPLKVTGPEARLAPLLGWTGLGLILLALFVVRPATMWPGPLTVLVVFGTMLVLRYGEARRGVRLVLALPPMRWLGDISYSLYLWHWPLVVIAEVDGPLTTAEGWSIVGISIGLAALTYYLVEGPARKARFWAPSPLGLAGGLTLALIVAGSGVYLSNAHSVSVPINAPGAAAGVAVQQSATQVAPPLQDARKDTGDIYARGCPSNYADASVRPCVFDYRTGPGDPTVVGVGDSKMGQWMPALQRIAQQRHWQLISMTKAGCPFSDIRRLNGTVEYTSCEVWNQAVLAKVRELRPTLLVTTQLQYYPAIGEDGKPITDGTANHDELIRGLTDRLSELRQMGQPVVTITETPRMGSDMADCVSLHLKDLGFCSRPRDAALHGLIVPSAAKASDTPTVDLNNWLCTMDSCPAVNGDVLVYRDDHHLTATYSRTLAPFLEQQLALALAPTLDQSLRMPIPATTTPTSTDEPQEQGTKDQPSPGSTP